MLNRLLLAACGLGLVTTVSAADAALPHQVAETYAALAYRGYHDSVVSATALRAAIAAFTAAPSAEGLTACRAAWLAAREDYVPTEAFRFASGPIDADPDNLETKINGWPLDEQWLDATPDAPTAGIINAVAEYPVFSPSLLVELNEKGGEKNIATGFHAIEFLLWGVDRSKTGPGDRPFTDYIDGGTARNQDRRRAYLLQAADLLVAQLTTIAAAWDPAGAGNYRSTFLALPAAVAGKQAFTGVVMLAGDELSGERLAVAYETQDQEEEQSCFSDNTHRDTILNAEGIQRLWLGTAKDVHGPGLEALVAAASPAAAAKASASIAAAIAAAKAIPAPFDQAIQGGNDDPGRKAVLATIEALETATDDLVAAAKASGIDLEFGANANNAIVGAKDLRERLPAVVAAVKAGDAGAAKAAVDGLFDRWVRFETAISREAPVNYRNFEAALNALRNQAVRAKKPDPAKVQAAADAVAQQVDAVLPLLKHD
jgi:putative iron-regulated protein